MRVRRGVTGVLLTAAAVALGLGSGCGSGSESGSDSSASGETVKVIRTESFDGWVLDSAAAYASYQTHEAVIEGLLRFGSDGESVEAGLADEWDYDAEAQTWTFHIREGARFSDGDPVTSADVAFSLDVWKQGPNFGSLYDRVKRIRTPDEQTAIFEMKTPDSVFDSLLAASVSGVMPADFGGVSEDEYYREPVGAGAYKVDKWSLGGQIVLSANKYFYDPERPHFEKVVIDVVTDPNERTLLFDSGDADVVEY
ncbi:MAG: ABC transporter substrate-binding protein, partial [Candidatus Rokuibacteriota bacterium]